MEYVVAEPRPSAMVESLRAVGYSPATAVADLIDNSVAARAANVWVSFWWDGAESHVRIRDDGRGMAPDELTNAMRPGTIGPWEERAPEDLGRFGLGLKTASFSQCRRLTVASRREGGTISYRRWDLDYVRQADEWRLLTEPAQGSEDLFEELTNVTSGTVVAWEQMDRVVGDARKESPKAQDHFLETIRDVEDHLAMVFHRFLAGPRPKLRVWIDAGAGPHAIKPWDPFLETHDATICTPFDEIDLAQGRVTVKGFVLPHKSKLTADEHRRAGGPGGWNARQGFYVYRGHRLVVPGSWLGIGSDRQWVREEHYKLARIRVDIPNSMDQAWHLDVKKSDARPPAEIRERLKDLALKVRGDAKRVFASKGGVFTVGKKRGEELEHPWKTKPIDGRPCYRIDRQHPLITKLKATIDPNNRSDLDLLLRLLEETVPIDRIWFDTAATDNAQPFPFELAEDEELVGLARAMYAALRDACGCSHDEAIDRMASGEPFARRPDLLDELKESK